MRIAVTRWLRSKRSGRKAGVGLGSGIGWSDASLLLLYLNNIPYSEAAVKRVNGPVVSQFAAGFGQGRAVVPYPDETAAPEHMHRQECLCHPAN